MSKQKLIAATIIASLITSSVALAAPPPVPAAKAHGTHGKQLRHTPRIAPVPKAAPRHRLPSNAAKVLIGGVTLWMIGSSYYQWKNNQKAYVPVTVTPSYPATTTTTSINGPYYERVPDGSNAVLINGTQYFNHNGEFYLPVNRNGTIVYVKVQL